MADQLETWAPRTAAALRRTGPVQRRVLLERLERWRAAARRLAPRDRGDLARAIDGHAGDDRAAVTMPSQYSVIEEGGTIRGRPWLAVPIAPAARLLPGPRSDTADLFVLTARDGRRFLASRTGGGIQLRWRLMREVRLRARGFMARAMTEAANALPDELLDAMEREVLGG